MGVPPTPVSGGRAKPRIRKAEIRDLSRINEIYNQAVLRTDATFDTEPKTMAYRREWFQSHGPMHPVLVAVVEDWVCGWASLSRYSERPAYERTAEISIYIDEQCRGEGIGSLLVKSLLEEARKLGYHAVIARITSDNPASVRLHESAGFFPVGNMREVGVKFGRLLDVLIMELLI
jgi:L-amino acid N-acyltransferase YncA